MLAWRRRSPWGRGRRRSACSRGAAAPAPAAGSTLPAAPRWTASSRGRSGPASGWRCRRRIPAGTDGKFGNLYHCLNCTVLLGFNHYRVIYLLQVIPWQGWLALRSYTTGCHIMLIQTTCWRLNKSYILVHTNTKTELLFWCHREVWINVMCHPVYILPSCPAASAKFTSAQENRGSGNTQSCRWADELPCIL